MKTVIKYRLILAFLLATGAVVACMVAIMQWSVNRGFLQYVNTIEVTRLERLATELEHAHLREGNWRFLQNNSKRWVQLLSMTMSPDRATPERLARLEKALGTQRVTSPLAVNSGQPSAGSAFEVRVLLLDEGQHLIAGPSPPSGKMALRTLYSSGKVIGYLGLKPKKHLTDALHLRFVEQQKVALALVAVVMLLVSIGISLPLANRIVQPVKGLTEAIHRLASGEFSIRVPEKSTDELGQLARDVNYLAHTLEKNESVRRQWLADISHELRTPLAILRGEVEALQDGIRQATPEALGSLHGEIVRLSRLVDDLHQLSLSDIGVLTCRREPVEVGEILVRVGALFEAEFAQNALDLKIAVPQVGPCPVYADPERLHQLFGNLFDNSMKYTDTGGVLEVRLTRLENSVRIQFLDSLPGVPEAELPHLFDRFYRVDSSRNRATGGAGLGLAICRDIVEAHEGTITAQTAPLHGLMITIELPLTEVV